MGNHCISASDRAKLFYLFFLAIRGYQNHMINLTRIFPLIQKQGGVPEEPHTEAAIDFARLAGFKSAGVIVEIMNEDGTMARLPQLAKVAKKFD
jgi:3,4-dihydroxy 2-butanone 4-phosphate synthase/GTP cyclohydrolase II